jgi:protein-S-isoprenylcysteine O-methyltransferase
MIGEQWVPAALAIVVWLGELPSFRAPRADASAADRGSHRFIALTFTAGYAAAFWIAYRSAPVLSDGALWAGAALVLAGVGFRVWAIRTLGRFFTRSVQVSVAQPVIDRGPYRLIRHPSYTGGIVAGLGIGLALRNPLSLAAIVAALAAGYVYRITVEERALLSAIGEPYRAYMARTHRLIPFIF